MLTNSLVMLYLLYPSITMMWQILVCLKKDEDEWHHKKCLYGQHSDYGIKKIPLCLVECNGSNSTMVEWKRFSMETTMSKVEHPLKKLIFVYKKTNNEESIEYFKPKLQNFVKHNFVSRSQNKQFKAFFFSFPKNTIVFIVNFVENYSFEVQNEVQFMHWHLAIRSTYWYTLFIAIIFIPIHLTMILWFLQNTISTF